MPDQIIPITQLDTVGVILDNPPVSLPPNAFTNVRNVRFKDGAVRKMEGEVDIFTGMAEFFTQPRSATDTRPLYGALQYIAWWPSPNQTIRNSGYYIFVIENLSTLPSTHEVFAMTPGAEFGTGLAGNERLASVGTGFNPDGKWQHTLFNGGFSFILNNGIEKPQYITDPEGNIDISNLELNDLPGWDSYNVVELIVSDTYSANDDSRTFETGQSIMAGVTEYAVEVSRAGITNPITLLLGAGFTIDATGVLDVLTFTAAPAGDADRPFLLDGDTLNVNYRSINPVVTRAAIVRSFGNFLVAGNLVERATENNIETTTIVRRLTGVVRTSDIAQPGAIPNNWDPFAVGVSTADEFVIADTGTVQDLVTLQGNMYLYTNSSISVMRLTGNAQIPLTVQPVTEQYGALTSDSVLEYDGKHFVIGSNDIYLFGGHPGSIQSVSDTKIRNSFFNRINPININTVNLFTLRYAARDEIWICFPTLDSLGGEQDEAYIWNYRNGTWTIRTLNSVVSGGIGPLPGGGVPSAVLTFAGESGSDGVAQVGTYEVQTIGIDALATIGHASASQFHIDSFTTLASFSDGGTTVTRPELTLNTASRLDLRLTPLFDSGPTRDREAYTFEFPAGAFTFDEDATSDGAIFTGAYLNNELPTDAPFEISAADLFEAKPEFRDNGAGLGNVLDIGMRGVDLQIFENFSGGEALVGDFSTPVGSDTTDGRLFDGVSTSAAAFTVSDVISPAQVTAVSTSTGPIQITTFTNNGPSSINNFTVGATDFGTLAVGNSVDASGSGLSAWTGTVAGVSLANSNALSISSGITFTHDNAEGTQGADTILLASGDTATVRNTSGIWSYSGSRERANVSLTQGVIGYNPVTVADSSSSFGYSGSTGNNGATTITASPANVGVGSVTATVLAGTVTDTSTSPFSGTFDTNGNSGTYGGNPNTLANTVSDAQFQSETGFSPSLLGSSGDLAAININITGSAFRFVTTNGITFNGSNTWTKRFTVNVQSNQRHFDVIFIRNGNGTITTRLVNLVQNSPLGIESDDNARSVTINSVTNDPDSPSSQTARITTIDFVFSGSSTTSTTVDTRTLTNVTNSTPGPANISYAGTNYVAPVGASSGAGAVRSSVNGFSYSGSTVGKTFTNVASSANVFNDDFNLFTFNGGNSGITGNSGTTLTPGNSITRNTRIETWTGVDNRPASQETMIQVTNNGATDIISFDFNSTASAAPSSTSLSPTFNRGTVQSYTYPGNIGSSLVWDVFGVVDTDNQIENGREVSYTMFVDEATDFINGNNSAPLANWTASNSGNTITLVSDVPGIRTFNDATAMITTHTTGNVVTPNAVVVTNTVDAFGRAGDIPEAIDYQFLMQDTNGNDLVNVAIDNIPDNSLDEAAAQVLIRDALLADANFNRYFTLNQLDSSADPIAGDTFFEMRIEGRAIPGAMFSPGGTGADEVFPEHAPIMFIASHTEFNGNSGIDTEITNALSTANETLTISITSGEEILDADGNFQKELVDAEALVAVNGTYGGGNTDIGRLNEIFRQVFKADMDYDDEWDITGGDTENPLAITLQSTTAERRYNTIAPITHPSGIDARHFEFDTQQFGLRSNDDPTYPSITLTSPDADDRDQVIELDPAFLTAGDPGIKLNNAQIAEIIRNEFDATLFSGWFIQSASDPAATWGTGISDNRLKFVRREAIPNNPDADWVISTTAYGDTSATFPDPSVDPVFGYLARGSAFFTHVNTDDANFSFVGEYEKVSTPTKFMMHINSPDFDDQGNIQYIPITIGEITTNKYDASTHDITANNRNLVNAETTALLIEEAVSAENRTLNISVRGSVLTIIPVQYSELASFVSAFTINNTPEGVAEYNDIVDNIMSDSELIKYFGGATADEARAAGRITTTDTVDKSTGVASNAPVPSGPSDTQAIPDTSRIPNRMLDLSTEATLAVDADIVNVFDPLRPWPMNQVNLTREYPIFATAIVDAETGELNQNFRGADLGFLHLDDPYTSFIERIELGLTPEFDTETMKDLALWADGGTPATFGGVVEQATLNVSTYGSNSPGSTQGEFDTTSSASARDDVEFEVGESYKVDLRTQGRFLNFRIDDGTENENAWRLSGLQATITKGGTR